MSATVPLPVLVEGGSRLDWMTASYRADVTIKGAQAIIVHQLTDAPELVAQIESGQAQWATEFRCPRTLHSREDRSQDQTQRLDWNEEEAVGDTFLLPGLVAVKDLVLDPSGLNPFGWTLDAPVHVPAGWWLARAEARRVNPLVASLVHFKIDENLEPGQMAVNEDTDGDNPYFVVRMAKDLFESRKDDRDIQIAGLIGACARLPGSSMGQDSTGLNGDNHDHALAQELRRRFEGAGIDDWNSDEFDPIMAATWLERFYVAVPEEGE